MTLPKSAKVTTTNFSSWFEFLTYCNQEPQAAKVPYSTTDSRDASYTKWSSTASFADAQRVSIDGDPAAMARVKAMAEGFEGSFTRGARDTSGMVMQWDYAGEVVDMDRYLTGDPENMIRFEPDDRLAKGKIVSVAVDIVTSSGTSAAAIERRGAAVVALIDLLEQTGRRVEINLVGSFSEHSSGSKRHCAFCICIKRADEGVDMARIVYSLSNPSMLRRHLFRFSDIVPDTWHSGPGYSYPNEDGARVAAGDADLFIGGRETPIIGDSDYSARRWLETKLKRITEAEG